MKGKPFPGALLLVVCAILAGCDRCTQAKDDAASPEAKVGTGEDASSAEAQTLQMTDVKVGSGAEATPGKKVSVLYTGTLTDGTVFDSAKDRAAPFGFVLGSGLMIAGWDQGIKGMRVGGVRKLVIPPQLAYGSRGFGGVIPPNSTLIFEIELLEID